MFQQGSVAPDSSLTFNVKIYLSPEKMFEQNIQVTDDQKMEQIKIKLMDKHAQPDQDDPNWSKYVVSWKDITLSNAFNIRSLQKCLHNSNIPHNKIQTLSIFPFSNLPGDMFKQILILWTDSNFQQNFKTYKFITQKTTSDDRLSLIQFQSNQQLNKYIDQNRLKIYILFQMRRIFFISNMNRKPYYKQEGIETLRTVRKLLQNQTFVFYIGDVNKTQETLQKAFPDKKDRHNVLVINSPKQLAIVFVTNFLNPMLFNNSIVQLEGIGLEQEQM